MRSVQVEIIVSSMSVTHSKETHPVVRSCFPILVCLFLAMNVYGSPLDIPGNQTFDALKTALEAYENTGSSAEINRSVAEAKRMIDRGRLLLIAGRMRDSAMLAEQARLKIELIALQMDLERLEEDLDAETEKKQKKEKVLSVLKARLVSWRTETETNKGVE